ncbi:MAG: NAD(P)-binding domain-containing protein, partial [Gammaproteobacteria bacterium]
MRQLLIDKLNKKTATIGIVGLGYVGMPLAIRYADAGYQVLGLDIDPEKITKISSSKTYIKHIPDQRIKAAVSNGFEATVDFSRATEADALILCVPTPLGLHREPDLSFIVDTMESLLPYLKSGQVISLESTTYPGTTDEELKPRIESTGLTIGEDAFLVYSPEREDPGNQDFTTQTTPKVCGGCTQACLEVGIALYSHVIDKVVPVSSTRTA